MSYAILRTQKLKDFAQVKSCADHHSRKRKTHNADPAINNELLIGSGDPSIDVQSRLDQSGAHYRSNSVKAIEVLLTASPDYFRPNSPGKAGHYEKQPTEAFKQQATKWLEEYFGKDNVVSVILHLDESTPHIQAIIVPIDNEPRNKGPQIRLNAKKFTGDSKKLSQMQDSFAKSVEDLGLERGIRNSKATHNKIKAYYGEINKPFQKFKIPTVDLPSTYLTQNAKEDYAKFQNDKISKNLKPQLNSLIRSAKLAKLAEKKKREYQETAKYYENENSNLKKIIRELKMYNKEILDELRDIDLYDVAEELGMQYRNKVYMNDSDMWIKIHHTENGYKFYDHYHKKGGLGAIDLVCYVMDCDFKQAVSWLADRFNYKSAVRSVRNYDYRKAESKVDNAVKERKPYLPPVKYDDDKWQSVRRYLTEKRMLDPVLVDELYQNGFLYATKNKNHTNIVFTNKHKNLAEIVGMYSMQDGSKFRGLAPGSDLESGGVRLQVGENPKTLILVEGGIDAISYKQLYPNNNYIVMSTVGARFDGSFIYKALKAGWEVICGYDDDEKGNKAYEKLKEKYPQIQRHKPDRKDWNEDLQESFKQKIENTLNGGTNVGPDRP